MASSPPEEEEQGTGDATSLEAEEASDLLQSNLPLLFANGSPSSLESMTLIQLQYFLMFVLKCENGNEVSSLEDISRPEWWPADLPFHDDLLVRRTKKGLWSSKMRYAIKECYRYNNALFLLEFSRRLMHCTQQMDKVVTVDNGDGTRSMRSAATQKLLVTFRGENQDYDKRLQLAPTNFNTHSPLKGSGCSMLVSTNNCSDPGLPQCVDLYLCENCGSDFGSLSKVLAHERICGQQEEEATAAANDHDSSSGGVSNAASTSVLSDQTCCGEDQLRCRYFDYLKLRRKAPDEEKHVVSANPPPPPSPSKSVVRPKPSSYSKFLSIDVASPLGQYICTLSRRNPLVPIDFNVLCSNDRKGMRSVGVNGFPVTYRGPKRRLDLARDHHVYCFNRAERRGRLHTLDSGLTPRAHRLYEAAALRRPEVRVEKLKFKQTPPPKNLTVKLKFNDELAARIFLKRPTHADKRAAFVPVLRRLKLSVENPPPSPGWIIDPELVNPDSVDSERRPPPPSNHVQLVDLCSSSDSDVDVLSSSPPVASVVVPKILTHLTHTQ